MSSASITTDELIEQLKAGLAADLLPVSDELRDQLLETVFHSDKSVAKASARLLAQYDLSEQRRLQEERRIDVMTMLLERRFGDIEAMEPLDLALLLEIASDASTEAGRRARVFLGGHTPVITQRVRNIAISTLDSLALEIAALSPHRPDSPAERAVLLCLAGDLSRLEAMPDAFALLAEGCGRLPFSAVKRVAERLAAASADERWLKAIVELADQSSESAEAVAAGLKEAESQALVNRLCGFWLKTSDARVARLTRKLDWVATAPSELRILSALNAGRSALLADAVPLSTNHLLDEYIHNKFGLSDRALACLQSLTDNDSLEKVVSVWMKTGDHRLAKVVASRGFISASTMETQVVTCLLNQEWNMLDKLGTKIVPAIRKYALTCDAIDLREHSRMYIRNTLNQAIIDELWALADRADQSQSAAHDGKNALAALLVAEGRVCQSPCEVMVKSYLLIAPDGLARSATAQVVSCLLGYVSQSAGYLRNAAWSVLLQLKSGEAIEELCRLAIKGHEYAMHAVAKAGYQPEESGAGCALLVLSGNVSRYLEVDAAATILAGFWQELSFHQQSIIVRALRDAKANTHLAELLLMKLAQKDAVLSDAEWECVAPLLLEMETWERMWEAVHRAPAYVGYRLLGQLLLAGWRPGDPAAIAAFEELGRAARTCAPIESTRLHLDVRELPENTGVVALSASAGKLATVDENGAIRIRSLPDLTSIELLKGIKEPILQLHFDLDEDVLHCVTASRILAVSIKARAVIGAHATQSSYVNSSFSSDRVALVTKDGCVEVRLLGTYEALSTADNRAFPTGSMCLSADGACLALGGFPARLIRLSDKKEFPLCNRQVEPVGALAIVANLVVAHQRGVGIVTSRLSMDGPVDERVLSKDFAAVALHPWKSNQVAALGGDGQLQCWNLDSFQEVGPPLFAGRGRSFVCDRFGQAVVVVSEKKAPLLWCDPISVLSRLPASQLVNARLKCLPSSADLSGPERSWCEFLLALGQAAHDTDIEINESWEDEGGYDIGISDD